MFRKCELYLKAIISGKKKGWLASLIKSLLLPLSYIYKFFSNFKNWLYDYNLMRCYVPPVPLVISVGNIVAGGTGKTPVTLMLVNAFYEKYPVAILSRGYRSKAENLETPVILSEGQGPLYPASYCGDEPYIFALRYPKAHIFVGPNRKKSSCMAAKAGAQVIILDDALQHRKLTRDFDVIVVDANDPFGRNHFLPRGFLREEVAALKRAHLIIINHINTTEQFTEIEKKILKITTVPIIGTNYQLNCVRDLKGNEIICLNERKVGMFCSIANPDYFKNLLTQLGIEVVAEYHLPDHDKINEKKLQSFALHCAKKGCEWLICTEKDQVKLSEQINLCLPVAWVQIDLKIVQKQEEWQKFIDLAISKI